jgi:hypothetical protein
MNKIRQSGFIDRFAATVLATALVASLAMAAENGLKPAASARNDDAISPTYILPDAKTAPFIEMLLFD